MNAPLKGWSTAALSTVRQYRDGAIGPGQVLDVLARERIPACLDYDYENASQHTRRLCEAAVALVEARDASVFGDAIESQPKPANSELPSTVHAIREFIEQRWPSAHSICVSNIGRNWYAVTLCGIDKQARDDAERQIAMTFECKATVEERG